MISLVATFAVAALASIGISTASAPPPTNSTTQQESCAANSFNVAHDDGTGTWPYRTYRSTNLTSPVFNISKSGPNVAPGSIFLTIASFGAEYQEGPYIMSSAGDLIWSGGNITASNLHVQNLFGEPVMSYWTADGEVRILNSKLQTVYTVCPKMDIVTVPGSKATCVVNTHESIITPQNTMLVTVYNVTQADLTSVGGPKNGWVYDSLAVEVDVVTNEVLWMWSSLEHVSINSTHAILQQGAGQTSSDPYDWFHMNSIQPFEDGVLINSRTTWSSYYVARNGSMLWTINGQTGGDFGSLPDGAGFSWQHHARLHPSPYDDTNQVLWTCFADNNAEPTHNESLALGLLLDLPPSPSRPPTLYSHLKDPSEPVYAFAEGSYQLLGDPHPNTTAFVGYGIKPLMKEFSPDGQVLYSASFSYANETVSAGSYRAFKEEWHSTPDAPLSLVVERAGEYDALTTCADGSSRRGYVSWSGATDVQEYIVKVGSEEDALVEADRLDSKGFETEFVVPMDAKHVQIEAVKQGEVVGSSPIVAVA